jgi:hypothetical protein
MKRSILNLIHNLHLPPIGAIAIATCASVGFLEAAAIAQPASPPIFENIQVSPGFTPDPVVLRGISGGSTAAQTVSGRDRTATGPCVGFVDASPDHTMTLTNPFSFLSVEVQSSEDTTLVVRGPGGAWCNDDMSGKNPGIAGEWLEGTYQIWIGSYQKDQYHPYILRLTQIR